MYKIFKASQIVLDKTFFHQCNIVSMIFGLFLVKLAKLCIHVFGINFSPLSVFVYLDILYLCIWIFCICVFGLNFSPLWKRVGAGYLGYNQALVWVKLGKVCICVFGYFCICVFRYFVFVYLDWTFLLCEKVWVPAILGIIRP